MQRRCLWYQWAGDTHGETTDLAYPKKLAGEEIWAQFLVMLAWALSLYSSWCWCREGPSSLVSSHHTNENSVRRAELFSVGHSQWMTEGIPPFFPPVGPNIEFLPSIRQTWSYWNGTQCPAIRLGPAQCQELKEFSWHHGVKIKNDGHDLEAIGGKDFTLCFILRWWSSLTQKISKVRNATPKPHPWTSVTYIKDRAKWLAC